MKRKEGMKLPHRIAAIMISCAVVFALMLVIGIGSAGKAYAAAPASGLLRDSLNWEITADGTLKLGKSGETQVLDTSDRAEKKLPGYERSAEELAALADGTYSKTLEGMYTERNFWPWLVGERADSVIAIEIVGKVKIIGDMSNMFSWMPNATSITGLSNIDVTEVILMNNLFGQAVPVQKEGTDEILNWSKSASLAVEEIDISTWNNLKKLVATQDMFFGCEKLKKISINFDTRPDAENGVSALITMHGMFSACKSLESVTFGEYLDTSSVDSMNGLFYNCSALKSVDISSFDSGNVVLFNNMFNGCTSLKTINGLRGLDTSNARKMNGMFRGCKELTNLNDIEGWNPGEGKLEHLWETFYGCEQVENLDLSGWDTRNVWTVGATFCGCKNLKNLDLSGWDTSKVEHMYDMFNGCNNLKKIEGLDKFDTSSATTMRGMFRNCYVLENVADALLFDTSQIKSGTNGADNVFNGANKLEESIVAKKESGDYSSATKTKLDKAAEIAKEIVKGKTGSEALDLLTELTESGVFIKADGDMKTARDAVEVAAKAERDAEKAKQRYKNNPTAENKQKAEETAEKAVKALSDAKAAVEKAIASAAATGNATMKADAKALEDEYKKAETAQTVRETGDAIDKAKEAVDNAKKLKAEADKLAAEKPGSDEAIAAAVKAAAAAAEAQKLAAAAADAAKATGNDELVNQAAAVSGNADTARADANKLVTEQKQKKADALIAKDPKSPEAQAAQNEATEAAKQELAENQAMFGANSPQAQDAQNRVNIAQQAQQKIDVAVQQDAIKVGDVFEVGGQKYEVLTLPASGNPEAAFAKGKNAKSVIVPQTVVYNGKTFDVTEINTKAFYKKTRKVTVGANVDTIDKQAFKGSKVATVVLKTKDLTKKSAKGSLKGSKVKTVQVKVGSKKVNKKFVKKYKKIFTKKNAGKKVTVK